MAKGKAEKKETRQADPWTSFMEQASGDTNPIYVCCFLDEHGALQIKANGKILSCVGLVSSTLEFFRAEMFKNWEDKLKTSKAKS